MEKKKKLGQVQFMQFYLTDFTQKNLTGNKKRLKDSQMVPH